MKNTQNKDKSKVSLKKGDRILYTKDSKTLSFTEKGGEKIYLNSPILIDKVCANFIRSADDFISFSIILGAMFSLQGKLVEQSENYYIFEFTKEFF